MDYSDDRNHDSTPAPPKWSRREFVGAGIAAGLATACAQTGGGGARTSDSDPDSLASDLERKIERDNIYTRLLGVHPHLPAHGHATRLGGCRMPAEVIEAMVEANEYFVNIDDLMVAAGKRVAEVVKAEAALVTSGAAGALLLGAAACLTGTDEEKMKVLPHPTWPRRECVIQKAHRYPYDHAIRASGMTFVEVEGKDELMNALRDTTAMLFGLPRHGPADEGTADVVQPEELIEIGKKAGVPVMIDGASRLPPAGNLTIYNELGADLVAVSGGKGLRGPQSTGILSGRSDLIEAARMQASPRDYIGRGMKVGKEEIIGLIVALNRYEKLDHDAILKQWEHKAVYVADELQGVPGLVATVQLSGRGAPCVDLVWDEKVIPLSTSQARETLGSRAERRVAISTLFGGNKIQTRCLRDGEEVLVARYLREFFTNEARG